MNDFIQYVFVDSNEGDKFIKKTKAFFKKQGLLEERVSTKPLGDYGDLAVFLSSHQILNVERKTIADFCSSYFSGHIQDQAVRMNNACYNYCCIVYGTIDDLKRISKRYPPLKKITQKSINKMAVTLEILYGLPVFFVDNEAQYFLKILEIAEVIHKSSGKKIQIKSKVTIIDRPDVNMLSHKLGEKTSMMLLNEFGSPKGVLDASREDLLKIKGVGDVTVSKIKELKLIFEEGYHA